VKKAKLIRPTSKTCSFNIGSVWDKKVHNFRGSKRASLHQELSCLKEDANKVFAQPLEPYRQLRSSLKG